MDDYNVGDVFNLYENDTKEYVVLNKQESSKTNLFLVMPIDSADTKIKADLTKTILLEAEKGTDNVQIITDKDKITDFFKSIIQ